MSDAIKLSSRRASTPVEIEEPVIDKVTGEVVLNEAGEPEMKGHQYELREMSGKERDTYLTALMKRSKPVMGGTTGQQAVGIQNFDGIQSDLITRCLFDMEAKKLVDRKTVDEWPSHVQQALFDAASEMNALDEESQKKAKNG